MVFVSAFFRYVLFLSIQRAFPSFLRCFSISSTPTPSLYSPFFFLRRPTSVSPILKEQFCVPFDLPILSSSCLLPIALSFRNWLWCRISFTTSHRPRWNQPLLINMSGPLLSSTGQFLFFPNLTPGCFLFQRRFSFSLRLLPELIPYFLPPFFDFLFSIYVDSHPVFFTPIQEHQLPVFLFPRQATTLLLFMFLHRAPRDALHRPSSFQIPSVPSLLFLL